MWQTEASTQINAPVETVYGYLADFRRHAEWSRGVAAIEPVTNGAIGVGTEFKATETVPMKFESISRITALEPNRRIAWEAWVEGRMRTRWAFDLTPAGGGTRLVQQCTFEPIGVVSEIMLRLMRRRQIPKENRRSLERIKAILERGG